MVGNSAGLGNVFGTNRGGGIRMDASGGANHRIVNSILAYNSVSNPNDPARDCVLFDQGLDSAYNHVQAPSTCSFSGTGDVVGGDPQLVTALADNGGPTPTHALLPGSPARDSADPAGCVGPGGMALPFDQRGLGFPRVSGERCDKGAFEATADLIFRSSFE